MINKLAAEIHLNNCAKGFYEKPANIPTMLALVHSEVSEALEADRGNSHCTKSLKKIQDLDNEQFKTFFKENVKDTFEDEIADSMIRLLDLASYLDIDIESHIKAKVRYNTLRPHKHGKVY